MTDPVADSLDGLLERLEASIALLSDGSAPLETLVAAHEQAGRLAAAAARELVRLEEWAGRVTADLPAGADAAAVRR